MSTPHSDPPGGYVPRQQQCYEDATCSPGISVMDLAKPVDMPSLMLDWSLQRPELTMLDVVRGIAFALLMLALVLGPLVLVLAGFLR